MVITYHDGECFKVSQGDLTLAFNPPSKNSKLKVSKFGADVVLSSLNNEDFNGAETASLGEKEPFLIMGPGEYDTRGISVRGFGSDSFYSDGRKHYNTIYSVLLEGINMCFLGALSGSMPQDAKQDLEDIDILFVPVGGEGVLDYSESYKLAVGLEPKVIIPMHFPSVSRGPGIGREDALKQFLKEAGVENVQPLDRLTVKKKDLEGKQVEIVVLNGQ